MEAIWNIAPDRGIENVLELGGGESGLTSLLFPEAVTVNLDISPKYRTAACNSRGNVRFITADATALPFPDCAFDAVTMFDVIEHIREDKVALREAIRVLKPGGILIVTTPNERWRFPYHHWLRRLCPS